MKTEELNDYVFTKLVVDVALELQRPQLYAMAAAGGGNTAMPLTANHLRSALELLDQRRHEVFELLKEVRPDIG